MEFLVATVLAVVGIIIAIYTAIRSKQLSHPDFQVRFGEHAVRSNRSKQNPKHLIYLTSLDAFSDLSMVQLPYSIRNISEKTVHDIVITIDVPADFSFETAEVRKLIKRAGANDLLSNPFIKSRSVSSYLNLKRISYKIESLGPKQVATLGEPLDLSRARVPKLIPVPTTLNSVIKCLSEHEEVRAFVPIHLSVSAQDIEPKKEQFFYSVINGSVDAIRSVDRKKRTEFDDGEYEVASSEVSASTISLQNYANSFWLGKWPAGSWYSFRLPWRSKRMMKSEICHIVPVDSAAIEQQSDLNYPYFVGEVASFPIRLPNLEFFSGAHNLENAKDLMEYLGYRRASKLDERIMKFGPIIGVVCVLLFYLAVFVWR